MTHETSVTTIPLSCRRLKPISRLDEIVNFLKLVARPTDVPSNYIQENNDGIITINPCPIQNGNLALAETMYDLSINVWETKMDENKHRFYVRHRYGWKNGKITINMHQDPLQNLTYIQDEDSYFANLYKCKNHEKGCLYTFRDEEAKTAHDSKCKTMDEARADPIIVQTIFEKVDHPLQAALEDGWIDEYPQNKNFIIFDIESSLRRQPTQISSRQHLSQRHELLSIACNSFVNNKHTQKCWVISESSEEARAQIVQKFVKFCKKEQERMEVDQKLEISAQQLQIELDNTPFYKKDQRRKIGAHLNELRNALSLPILGYNSAKYDVPIISKYLFEAFGACNVSYKFLYNFIPVLYLF